MLNYLKIVDIEILFSLLYKLVCDNFIRFDIKYSRIILFFLNI